MNDLKEAYKAYLNADAAYVAAARARDVAQEIADAAWNQRKVLGGIYAALYAESVKQSSAVNR